MTLELQKMPLYNGIFYELCKTEWEFLPSRLYRYTGYQLRYDNVLDYLYELSKYDSESWFISSIIHILVMNTSSKVYRDYLRNGNHLPFREIIYSLVLNKSHEQYQKYTRLSDYSKRIDINDTHDLDHVLELIDMLNSSFDEDKFVMMKLMYG